MPRPERSFSVFQVNVHHCMMPSASAMQRVHDENPSVGLFGLRGHACVSLAQMQPRDSSVRLHTKGIMRYAFVLMGRTRVMHARMLDLLPTHPHSHTLTLFRARLQSLVRARAGA